LAVGLKGRVYVSTNSMNGIGAAAKP